MEISREEMIKHLLKNLEYINAGKEGVEEFIEQERKRYEDFSDLRIQNMYVINCCLL